MPDTRTHRGPAPEDERLFHPKAWPALRAATQDLCWLLSRAYSLPSAWERCLPGWTDLRADLTPDGPQGGASTDPPASAVGRRFYCVILVR